MKHFHSIKISVFSKPEDDEEKIKNSLLALIPIDMEKEKIELKVQSVKGFNERDIKIFEILLSKQRHTDAFFEYLMTKINQEQKNLLLSEKDSRLDENLDFFIRFDKEALLDGNFLITDSGSCFHIRISIAAFPAKKQEGLKIVENIFAVNPA